MLRRKAYCGGHGQSEPYLTSRPRSGGAALLRLNLAGTQPFIVLFGIKASIKPFLFVTLEGHFAAPRNYKAFMRLGYSVSLAQRRSDWQNLTVGKSCYNYSSDWIRKQSFLVDIKFAKIKEYIGYII